MKIKETPAELRKKNVRLKNSRDNLKSKSQEKAKTIKKMQDYMVEVKESRNKWKKKYKTQERNILKLADELNEKEELLKLKEEQFDSLLSDLKKN